jgi:hypothetical protein
VLEKVWKAETVEDLLAVLDFQKETENCRKIKKKWFM